MRNYNRGFNNQLLFYSNFHEKSNLDFQPPLPISHRSGRDWECLPHLENERRPCLKPYMGPPIYDFSPRVWGRVESGAHYHDH